MFRPSSSHFLADPYPTYKRLRQDTPIFYYEPWDKWVVTRYEDVNALLRDKRLGRVLHGRRSEVEEAEYQNSLRPEHAAFNEIQQGSLLEIEPPDHTRIRTAVHAAFTPKHVKKLQAKIEALCQRLVVSLQDFDEPFDLIKHYAEPIPVTVIADLLGVPAADRHKLIPWSKAIIGMFEPERTPQQEEAAVTAAADFADYIRFLMTQKRRSPEDDLITRFTQTHDADPAQLSESEVVANAILFLNAGHEAVVNVIGNGVYALLRHPKQKRRLEAQPQLLASATEEMMRFDTPLQFFERFTLEDITYKDIHLPRGSKLCLYYASANHDERVFEAPERFDIARTPNPHIAFGLGLHYCVGAPLARLELTTALRTLLDAFPKLRLAGECEYEPKNVFRYLKALEVSV